MLEKAKFRGQLRYLINIAVHYPLRRTGKFTLRRNGNVSYEPEHLQFGLVIRIAAALNSDLGAMPRYPQRAFQEQ
jgi:hypothetical protein